MDAGDGHLSEPQNPGEVLEYLHRTRDAVDRYHHQKEALGWGGAVFFVGASSVFVTQAPAESTASKTALSIALVLAFTLTLSYARRQFILREYASRLVQSTERLVLLIVARDPETMTLLEKGLRPPDEPHDPVGPAARGHHLGPLFPGRLHDDDRPNQFNRPPLLIETMRRARAFSKQTPEPSRAMGLERLAYLLMVLSAAGGLALVWS